MPQNLPESPRLVATGGSGCLQRWLQKWSAAKAVHSRVSWRAPLRAPVSAFAVIGRPGRRARPVEAERILYYGAAGAIRDQPDRRGRFSSYCARGRRAARAGAPARLDFHHAGLDGSAARRGRRSGNRERVRHDDDNSARLCPHPLFLRSPATAANRAAPAGQRSSGGQCSSYLRYRQSSRAARSHDRSWSVPRSRRSGTRAGRVRRSSFRARQPIRP